MNIIIPLGGKGERFKNNGYEDPKPLIKILGKEMIFYVLDNLQLEKDDKVFIIYYNLDEYKFKERINSVYPSVEFVSLEFQTKGAAETIFVGLSEIISRTDNKKCVLLDCDTFYTENVLEKFRKIPDSNAVFYTMNYEEKPIYSYIELDDCDKSIKRIIEKVKISDCANTGIYCFKDIKELYEYSKFIVENDIRFNNECYTSCIIDKMISDLKPFTGIELNPEFVFNLGTPEQVGRYIEKTHLFLFDLDGTLVLTDDIYFNVWGALLKKYNFELTEEIFKKYIQGNSDFTVIRSLIPSKYNEILNGISQIKDDLFIEYSQKIKIIDGVIDFLSKIKKHGHLIGIVTNCNRKVAEIIIKHIKINNLVDKLIIGSECKKTKPSPDPYLEAMNHFGFFNRKTIIFEDSKTGIQSGKTTFPKCLVGIETVYSQEELLNSGVNLTIKNFLDLEINIFLKYNSMNIEKIINYIRISLFNTEIKDIVVADQKLKGGFISDVIGLKIDTEKETLDCVLKLENKNETFLSKMANDLGLYEREYYFYDSLSKYVPVSTPVFYSLIKDEHFNNIGILMNNLVNLDYKLNLNLNSEKIEVSLKIIERLADLHAKFWNKDLQKNFKELKKHNDNMFNPKWDNFIKGNWPKFKNKWSNLLSDKQIQKAQYIVDNFQEIQNLVSDKNLTLCHGDVKSANIFYKPTNDGLYEPYFIDWQYICEGKGVQDLVFFMIESFEIEKINLFRNIFKDYYYTKLLENGVTNYSYEDYDKDFRNAIYYFPFFVAIWFGTVDEDELIDKNFPFFFIQRLFNFIE